MAQVKILYNIWGLVINQFVCFSFDQFICFSYRGNRAIFLGCGISSDNGLTPSRQQTITWANDGLVYWRKYTSLGWDVSNYLRSLRLHRRIPHLWLRYQGNSFWWQNLSWGVLWGVKCLPEIKEYMAFDLNLLDATHADTCRIKNLRKSMHITDVENVGSNFFENIHILNKANLRDLIAATGLVISNWIQIVNFSACVTMKFDG